MSAIEKERADAYLETVRRMEPDIAMVDQGAALASIAISLKRIADALESSDKYGQTGFAAISQAIVDGLREMR